MDTVWIIVIVAAALEIPLGIYLLLSSRRRKAVQRKAETAKYDERIYLLRFGHYPHSENIRQ